MLQMISHGLIAAAMFFVTGSFYERTNPLSIPNMGGLAKVLPITFAFFLGKFFGLSSTTWDERIYK